jgi:four helix bundle protein
VQDFRKIDVWHKAHALSIDVHKTLVKYRKVDAHLRSQMSRAARTIPATLVEGCGHDSQAELAKYCDMGIGSSSELEYWILTARDIGYFPESDFQRLTTNTVEVRKMLYGFRKAVRDGKRRPSDTSLDNSTAI